MNRKVWPAPAKLNLFLHILGRRPDRYHLLQTVFQFLDIGDELRFTLRGDGAVARARPLAGVPEERDLTVRAARALREATGCQLGADIEVVKRLPMGAGLGGGSSDAATTLVALNRLWDLQLPLPELQRIGLMLGADVPVFVAGRAAWAEGVGERLTPLELPEPWYVVLVPPCHVATAEIFDAPDLTRHCEPITIRVFLSGETRNVCEPVVRHRYPEVAAALDWLAAHAPARMSGTGAAVFATFADEAPARAVAARAPAAWQAFVARGRNRSPLHDE